MLLVAALRLLAVALLLRRLLQARPPRALPPRHQQLRAQWPRLLWLPLWLQLLRLLRRHQVRRLLLPPLLWRQELPAPYSSTEYPSSSVAAGNRCEVGGAECSMRVCRVFRDVQLNKFNFKINQQPSTHSKFVRKVHRFLTIVEMSSLNMDHR